MEDMIDNDAALDICLAYAGFIVDMKTVSSLLLLSSSSECGGGGIVRGMSYEFS